jgi:signal transduction histidine kinase
MEIVNSLIFNSIIVFLISGISFYLAILSYRQNNKSISNRTFSQFGIATGFWIAFAFFTDVEGLRNNSYIFAKLTYIALLTVSYTLFQFPFNFPRQRVLNKYIKYIWLFIGLLLGILTLFTNLVIKDLEFYSWGSSFIDGDLAGPFYLYMIIGPVSAIVQYLFLWKKFEANDKRQVKFFLVGLSIFMLTNIVLQSIVKPLITHSDELYRFGNYSAFFMIAFTSYAIVKHRLFDIKVLATEVITVIIWILLTTQLFASQDIAEFVMGVFILLLMILFGIMLIRSVVNEVRQREKLQELTVRLQALDKQKDEFLSMAAHELRAPMTAIKGYVSMVLEGDTGEIPTKARGFLADTSNITDRLIRLVNNMLNVSRIEEGRLTYQEEEEYLSVPVKEVFNQFVPEAERKNLKYTIEIPNELKDKVRIDPDRIQEVIGNFLSNAVKYTDQGFVKVKMSQVDGKAVRVEVLDSGPGISKEEQQKLFQKFHRVESNVGKTTGTGLGLYISKLLVEKFNGKIGVESEAGKGSNFWFELPLIT